MRLTDRILPEQLDDASLENLVYAAFERAKDEAEYDGRRRDVMAVLGMLWMSMIGGSTAQLRHALEAYATRNADARDFVLGPVPD